MFSILNGMCKFFHTRNMEKLLLFVSGELNFFQVCFYALSSSKLGFKTALPIKVILYGNNRNKTELCPFGKILFLFCCASSVLFNTSVVIKISLFSFRLNGLKSNYFCGELSQVSYS